MKRIALSISILSTCLINACSVGDRPVETGAEQLEMYLPKLTGRRIAIVANHTSLVGNIHLVDTLNSLHVETGRIMKVFVPEHGFRGDFEAGATISDEIDPITGIPVVSLYGSHKKPLPEDMADIDMVLFDVQDVGVRFYTYISTLHYVMEACAEQDIPLLILDRPNPNGGYFDGPVLKPGFESFIGMHPIPVVYGMTIGELAMMINGEGWLKNGVKCQVEIIPCRNYYHGKDYSLPVNPSPNLTSDHAIKLYPSVCFFEGTVISEGRGTETPFEVFGHPALTGDYSFTPKSIPGMSMNPKFKGQVCYGQDLRNYVPKEGWIRLYLNWLIDAYHDFPEKENFFTPFFEKLAGTDTLRKKILAGWDEEMIRESWKPELQEFAKIREKYLLYP